MSNCSAISTKRHRKYENRRQDLEQDCAWVPVLRRIRDGCIDSTSVTGKQKGQGAVREEDRQRRDRQSKHHPGTWPECWNVAFGLKGLKLGLNPGRQPAPVLGSLLKAGELGHPFSSFPQSFPASGSFPMSWLFTPGGQSIGASASVSVLPMIFRVDFL